MLNGREAKPSVVLTKIFEACPNNPREAIENRIGRLGEQFINCYTQQTKEIPGSHIEFAKKRLQLGTTLFYMLLEVTTIDEQQKKGNTGIPVSCIYLKNLNGINWFVLGFARERIVPEIVVCLLSGGGALFVQQPAQIPLDTRGSGSGTLLLLQSHWSYGHKHIW